MNLNNNNNRHQKVIVGDGWAALTLAGLFSQKNEPVVWVTGSQPFLLSPLPSFDGEFSDALELIKQLSSHFEIDLDEERSLPLTRQYKNKTFRKPDWIQKSEGKDVLWSPETRMAISKEVQFDLNAGEWLMEFRKKVLSNENIRIVHEAPVLAVREGEAGFEIKLGTGEIVSAGDVFFALNLNGLKEIDGFPEEFHSIENGEMEKRKRNISSLKRKAKPVSVLQVSFNHEELPDLPFDGGIVCVPVRDPGEEIDRNVWGYFLDEGNRSVWTMLMEGDEAEDNRQVGRKIKRIKNILGKAFSTGGWLPEGKDFPSSIVDEQYRFSEELIFSSPDVPAFPLCSLSGGSKIFILTDGFGFTNAIHQVAVVSKLLS